VELDSDNPIVIRDCTLDDVYVQMYQTAILNHLQQLIRVLELHYNGLGWEILRQQLRKNIPEDRPLYSAWILPDRKTYPGSCHLRRQLLANEWVGLLLTSWKTRANSAFYNSLYTIHFQILSTIKDVGRNWICV
jgi:hypothetical protein